MNARTHFGQRLLWSSILALAAPVIGCTTKSELPTPPPTQPRAEVTPQQVEVTPQVLLVAVDGMTARVLDPLLLEGRLPNLAQLIGSGARAPCMSENPMRSPALWTTVATGVPRAEHGIYDFVTGSSYWPAGQRGQPQKLVTSSMRQSDALWNLLTQRQRKSIVVGWMNTWPAEPIAGTMVAPYVALGKRKQTSIKGKIYLDAGGQTSPEAAFEALKPLVVAPTDVPDDTVQRFWPSELVDKIGNKIPLLRRYAYTVRWSLANALTNTAITERLLRQSPDTRLAMTYFDLTDTLAHRFWLFREPLTKIAARLQAHGLDPALAPQLKAAFGGMLDEAYVLVDSLVSRLRQAAAPDAHVVVVSDHGWMSWPEEHAPQKQVPFDGVHELEGVMIASGPGVSSGTIDAVSLYDIAPIVLHLAGMAVPDTFPGKVPKSMFREQWLARHPVRAEALAKNTRSKKRTGVGEDAPFANDEIERLRSLGYVQ